MTNDPRRAVLIGINNYRDWESAGDHERGSKNLLAPRNDMQGWFNVLRRLGVASEHITVLTSPALTRSELDDDEVICLEATTSNVRAVLQGTDVPVGSDEDQGAVDSEGLLQRLEDGGSDALALVVIAGHGHMEPEFGHTVALSDYAEGRRADELTGGSIVHDGVLSVDNLLAEAGKRAPHASVVVMVDACRSTGEGADMPTTTAPNQLLISASGVGEDSFERAFDGVWRSQFSWAAQTVLSQWSRWEDVPGVEDKVPAYLDISYSRLVDRCRDLLAVFMTKASIQHPELSVPQGSPLGEGAFLLPFSRKGRIARFAVDAPGHEFGEGVTEFYSDGKLIGRTIGAESEYWFTTTAPFAGTTKQPITTTDTNSGGSLPHSFNVVPNPGGTVPANPTTYAGDNFTVTVSASYKTSPQSPSYSKLTVTKGGTDYVDYLEHIT